MTPESKVTRRAARRPTVETPEKDHLDDLFARLDDLQKQANVSAVFGQPVEVGGRMLIPIASVMYGVSVGFGEGQGRASEGQEAPGGGSGAGGAGGVRARPLAVAEITPDGVHIEPIVDEQAVVLAGILAGAWSIFWIVRAVIKILRR